jgi:hypothetical protein
VARAQVHTQGLTNLHLRIVPHLGALDKSAGMTRLIQDCAALCGTQAQVPGLRQVLRVVAGGMQQLMPPQGQGQGLPPQGQAALPPGWQQDLAQLHQEQLEQLLQLHQQQLQLLQHQQQQQLALAAAAPAAALAPAHLLPGHLGAFASLLVGLALNCFTCLGRPALLNGHHLTLALRLRCSLRRRRTHVGIHRLPPAGQNQQPWHARRLSPAAAAPQARSNYSAGAPRPVPLAQQEPGCRPEEGPSLA